MKQNKKIHNWYKKWLEYYKLYKRTPQTEMLCFSYKTLSNTTNWKLPNIFKYIATLALMLT